MGIVYAGGSGMVETGGPGGAADGLPGGDKEQQQRSDGGGGKNAKRKARHFISRVQHDCVGENRQLKS